MHEHEHSIVSRTTLHESSVPPGDTGRRAIQDQNAVFAGWKNTNAGHVSPRSDMLNVGQPSSLSTGTEKTLQHAQIPSGPNPYSHVGPSPWHTLGTQLANPATAKEAIECRTMGTYPASTTRVGPIDTDVATFLARSTVKLHRVSLRTVQVFGVIGRPTGLVHNSMPKTQALHVQAIGKGVDKTYRIVIATIIIDGFW